MPGTEEFVLPVVNRLVVLFFRFVNHVAIQNLFRWIPAVPTEKMHHPAKATEAGESRFPVSCHVAAGHTLQAIGNPEVLLLSVSVILRWLLLSRWVGYRPFFPVSLIEFFFVVPVELIFHSEMSLCTYGGNLHWLC